MLMNDKIHIGIGEIIDFQIQLIDLDALSASIELKLHDHYVVFGGRDLFSSIPNSGVNLVGHFIERCFQVCSVDKTRDAEGHLVKVAFQGDQILGLSSLMNDDFFYPVIEFSKLSQIS